MRARLRSLLRSVAATAVVLAAVALVVGGAAVVASRTAAGRERLRPLAESLIGEVLSSDVSIGRIAGLGLRGLEIEDVSIDFRGEPALRAPVARVGLALRRRLPPRVGLAVSIDDFALDVRRDAQGRWNVAEMFASDSGEPPPAWLRAVTLSLSDGSVDLHGLAPEPVRFDEVSARGVVDLAAAAGPLLAVDELRGRSAPGTRLLASGWIGFEGETPMEIEVAAEPVAPADLRRLAPAWPQDRPASGWARLSGSFDAPVGEVHLASGGTSVEAWGTLAAALDGTTAVARPLSASVSVRGLDPAVAGDGIPAGTVSGTASLVASLAGDGSLRAPAIEARAWDSSIADVRAAWATLQARRDGADWKAGVQAAAPGDAWQGDATAIVAAAAPHAATAEVRLRATDPGSISPALREALGDSDLRLGAKLRADRLDERRLVDADLVLDGSRVRGIVLDEARGRLRASTNLLDLRDVVLRGAGTDLAGAGWLSSPSEPGRRELGAKLSGTADPAFLDGRLAGRLPFEATAWGRPGSVGARVDVKAGAEVSTPAGRARPRGTIDLAGLGGATPSAKARLAGAFEPAGEAGRVLGGKQELDLSGSWSRASSSSPASPALDRGDLDVSARAPDGRVQHASLRFERAGSTTRIDLGQLRVAPVDGPAWTLERPTRVALDDGSLDVGVLALRAGDARVALDGRLALPGSDRPGKISLDAHGVDLAFLCGLAGGRTCAGRVDARLSLAGTAARPEIAGRVEVEGLAVDGRDVGRLDLALRTDRGLVVDGHVDSPLGGRIDVGATLPLEAGGALPALAPSGPLSLRVRSDDFDVSRLRALAPPDTFSDLRGRAKVDVQVGGTTAAPRITGEATVPDLSVGLASTGLRLRRGRVSIRFLGDRAEIVELVAEDGKVNGHGSVSLASGSSPRLDLSIALDRLKVYDKPVATAVATGDLHLLGTLAAPEIEGDVVLDPVTIRPSLVPGQGGPKRDASIVVWNSLDPGAVRPGEIGTVGEAIAQITGAAADNAARESATWRALRLSVRAALGRDVAIRRNDADIRLSGEVWATKTPGDQLRLTGHVDSQRGWYVFQGRRLELEHAWVTFSGESPVDPYLNVAAVYRDSQVRITVSVQGTARKPALDLSSEPSLPQSDILAMLLFGKPASELSGGQGQGLQQEALGLLASYVAPGLERSVIDTFGLTSLTFQVPSGAGAGSIGIGRYLGDDVFVSITQDLGGTQTTSTRQQQGLAGSAVVVQYYLTPSVTVQGAASSQGESAIDVFWHMRFGGGAQATATPSPGASPSPAPSTLGPASSATPAPTVTPRPDGISVIRRGAGAPRR